MMDDFGSILLLLRHHRHLFPPPLLLPSTLRGSSIRLMLNHVLGYSWHFGSRGRPCTIYGSAYRTFSAAYAHTSPLFLSRSPSSYRVITRIRLRGTSSENSRQERERGIARRGVSGAKVAARTSTIFADNNRRRRAMEFLRDKKLSVTVARDNSSSAAERTSSFYPARRNDRDLWTTMNPKVKGAI